MEFMEAYWCLLNHLIIILRLSMSMAVQFVTILCCAFYAIYNIVKHKDVMLYNKT